MRMFFCFPLVKIKKITAVAVTKEYDDKKSDHENSAKEAENGTQKYSIHALVSKVNLFFIFEAFENQFFSKLWIKNVRQTSIRFNKNIQYNSSFIKRYKLVFASRKTSNCRP